MNPAEAKDAAAKSPFPRRLPVQPFPEQLQWINTDGPVELNQLRGKFVLLDFWTYCCINCMHVLPELKKIERAYPDSLVVIGVHSPKFEGEKDEQNIAEAIQRYDIEHPVVNDPQMILWQRFGVQAWPTLVLIDPEGYSVWGQSGEATFEQLDTVLQRAVGFYRRQGLLDQRRPAMRVAGDRPRATPLRFPGKVLADEATDRLFIADSNHNRIVVTRLDGTLIEVIGQGDVGHADGDYATAQFHQPQGMALDGASLYVADTENHLLRKVDLSARHVSTIAGLGHQSRQAPPLARMGAPLKTALNSPWALWIHDDDLLIAMAGAHQIWRMKLDGSGIDVFAGNGREDIVDGRPLPRRLYQQGFASLAQPSGLTSDGTWLYVADSEGSSIRAVPLDGRRQVRTVVGTAHLPGARLFTFGDTDGDVRRARLQHPLGVVYYRDKLYVADTYNDKIKVIDSQNGRTQTLELTLAPEGRADDPSGLNEPAGLTAAAGKLYVADTNHHRIAVIDLDRGGRLSTLPIPDLTPPADK